MGKNQQCQKTLRTANQYRINQEIKFLYTKKLKLNEQLFKLHLKCADRWQSIWPIIIQSIDYKLTKEMETHYNNLNRKLDKLQREKTNQAVPEAAVTVFSTPDDGCCDTRNM